MIDLSYFQNNNSNTQIFQNGGTWQTWVKPRGAKIVNFMVIGSGAGGGGGFLAAAGNKSGGSGGGTGAFTRGTIQANILPDILYIYCGIGGAGGIGGLSPTSGSSGESSYVCLTPNLSSPSNIILRSGTIPSVGGAAGSTGGVVGGGGETASVNGNNIFNNLGTFISQSGVPGSSTSTSTSNPTTMSIFIVGSSGGGGTSTAGGLTTPGPYPLIAATPINTNGSNGFIYYNPFGLIGPRGGGGGTTGGNGGNGAPGTGGGGGGAGTSSAGNGGRGGDGFIIITTNF
jgi:hypothetical protein